MMNLTPTLCAAGDVLVVDDAPESRHLLAGLLEQAGYAVRQAIDGEAALYEVLLRRPALIVLDIRMPGLDGFEVCRLLKENPASQGIPVIFVSMQNDSADQIRGLRLGAVDFLSKPCHPEAFLARVGNHLSHGQLRRQLENERTSLALSVSERTRELRQQMQTRRHAEARLHIYQRVFETTGEAMYVTDAEARIIEVNAAYSRITGYSDADVNGQRPLELRVIDDVDSPVWLALRESGHWSGELWDRRSNGEPFPKWLELSIVRDPDSGLLTHYVGAFSDISTLRSTEEQLRYMAYHDALTGLGNRTLFRERLGQEIAVTKRQKEKLAVLCVDLDRFKNVNESLGHEAGDRLLVETAAMLTRHLREGDLLARIGGDEFLIALRGIQDERAALQVAGTLVDGLSRPMELCGQTVYGSGSIGIALYPDDGADVDSLIKHADSAMYWAKASGRNQYRFYSADIDRQAQDKRLMQQELHLALERDEFELHFQPQMALGSGALIGAEALIRWRHPVYGLVPPNHFIALAEESDLIVRIGYWVVRAACLHLRRFQAVAGFALPVAINLSPRQFRQQDLACEIARIVAEAGVAPSDIELEITETTAMTDAEAAAEVLHQLVGRGFSIAIDDFGTGYSSLAYLRRFPVDKLKIDRSFVKDIPGSEHDAAIAAAVIQLAKSLGLRVVAEGVETPAQRDFLARHRCDFLQGYWYSKPLDALAFEQFIAGSRVAEQA